MANIENYVIALEAMKQIESDLAFRMDPHTLDLIKATVEGFETSAKAWNNTPYETSDTLKTATELNKAIKRVKAELELSLKIENLLARIDKTVALEIDSRFEDHMKAYTKMLSSLISETTHLLDKIKRSNPYVPELQHVLNGMKYKRQGTFDELSKLNLAKSK